MLKNQNQRAEKGGLLGGQKRIFPYMSKEKQ